jgi:predicted RNase H-like HicB family nuclease
MRREFTVLVERDAEGWYVGTVLEVRGCHTQARSLDALMRRMREALDLCLAEEDSEVRRAEFVGLQRLAVER